MGTADFVAALELAAEQQMYGVEYIRAILALPTCLVPTSAAETDITMHLVRSRRSSVTLATMSAM